MFAPIGISTYKRLNHLKKTISSLQRNTLAEYSDVFVFSDGPQRGDEQAVNEVRKYLSTVTGFRNFNVFERNENDRIFNNRDGIKTILDEYGRLIFLEEDVETSPYFLDFLNKGLDKYEDNDRVFSISGYCPPIYPGVTNEAFFINRFNAWGFGIWRDRFIEANLPIDPVLYSRFSKYNWRKLKASRTQGPDVINKYKQCFHREIDALDVRFMFYQFWTNRLTLYPPVSFANNIGFDGTGTHSGSTSVFDTPVKSEASEILFPEIIKVNYKVLKRFISFRTSIMKKGRRKSIVSKVIKKLHRIRTW